MKERHAPEPDQEWQEYPILATGDADLAGWRCRSVLVRLLALHPAELRGAIVHVKYLFKVSRLVSPKKECETTYRVHSLEHGVAVDVHVHCTSRLYTSIHHTITGICKAQILLLKAHLRVANGKRNVR
jgi:hypothetical protein